MNDTCVLGFTHHDMVTMFQSISSGEVVVLEVCRGYPLPFDPDDPNTEIVTTVAVTSPEQNDWANELERVRSASIAPGTYPQQQQQPPDVQSMPDLSFQPGMAGGYRMNRPGSADLLGGGPVGPGEYGENSSEFSHEVKNALGAQQQRPSSSDFMTIPITKGGMGFGFTIADSGFGQKVKKILDRARCKNLQEGDILIEINSTNVRHMSHGEVVQVLKDCTRGQEANITIQRGVLPPGGGSMIPPLTTPGSAGSSPVKNKYKKGKDGEGPKPKSGFLFRSKTPTADLYSTQEKEKIPRRPKTPLVDTRNISKTSLLGHDPGPAPFQRNDMTRASLGVGGGFNPQSNYGAYGLSDQFGGMNLHSNNDYGKSMGVGRGGELDYANYQQQPPLGSGGSAGYPQQQQQQQEYPGGYQPDPSFNNGYPDYGDYASHGGNMMPSPGKMYANAPGGGGPYNGYGYDPSGGYGYAGGRPQQQQQQQLYSPSGAYRAGSLPRGRKESTSFEHSEPQSGGLTRWPRSERKPLDCVELTVTLHRQESGFGFRIVGGTEEGSQV